MKLTPGVYVSTTKTRGFKYYIIHKVNYEEEYVEGTWQFDHGIPDGPYRIENTYSFVVGMLIGSKKLTDDQHAYFITTGQIPNEN